MNLTKLILIAFVSLFISCKKEQRQNKPPIVDAGPSQTILREGSLPTLTGNATDPDGRIVAYLWSKVTGDGGPEFVNAGAPTTRIEGTFIDTGTYVFQLMAIDNYGAVGVDTTTITVVP